MPKSEERGFTFIELLTVIAILGALAGLAIANFSILKDRAYDAVAQSAYVNVKTAVFAEATDDEIDQLNFFYYLGNGNGGGSYWSYDGDNWQNGSFSVPGTLPEPLREINLSKDIYPRIIYSYNWNETAYSYIWVDHLKSRHSYRYIHYKSPTLNIGPTETVIEK